MALVRILVDGFGLLQGWPSLAPGKPRHSTLARQELIGRLTRYSDVAGTPVTLVFDSGTTGRDPDETPSTADMEIVYSRIGQTAGQTLERTAFRLKPYGELLAVTDDPAEQERLARLGVKISACAAFVTTVEAAIAELEDKLRHHNQNEQSRFRSA